MSESQLVTVKPRASQALSLLTGMETAMMLETVKAQCFKCDPARVTDTQLAAFVSIAAEMGVNPLLPGMMYAFPIQGGGIVPMMGPDAVFKKLAEHQNVDSWKTTVYPEDVTLAPTHATTEIFLRNSQRPLSYTALLSEWKVGANPNWNQRPRHMLALRSLKQAARQVIHGVPFDEDERQIAEMQNVTPTGEAPPVARAEPPPRKKKGAAAIVEAEQVAETAAANEPAKVVEAAEPPRPVDPAPAVVDTPLAEKSVAPVSPRAFLKDGEEIEAVVEVVAATGLNITKDKVLTPSAQVELKGDFVGIAYHIGGGVAAGAEVKPAAPWVAGATVKAVLFGKLNNKAGGKVQVFVRSVEAVGGGMEV